jgi:hypothetical protein
MIGDDDDNNMLGLEYCLVTAGVSGAAGQSWRAQPDAVMLILSTLKLQ